MTELDPFVDRQKPALPAVAGEAVLSVRDLRVQFPTDDGWVTAVDGVSFSVGAGEAAAGKARLRRCIERAGT